MHATPRWGAIRTPTKKKRRLKNEKYKTGLFYNNFYYSY